MAAAQKARSVRKGKTQVAGDTGSGTTVLRDAKAVEQVQVEDHKPDGNGGGVPGSQAKQPG